MKRGRKKNKSINPKIRYPKAIEDKMLSLFDASPDMIAIGVPALRRVSLSFIFAGICIISSSTCQALGYSVFGMFISFARQIVVLIPSAYLLSRTGILDNVWYSVPIAEIMSLAMSLTLLRTALKKTGMLKAS